MIYKINEIINPEDISSLREAVGWNRMKKAAAGPIKEWGSRANDGGNGSYYSIRGWQAADKVL